MADSYLFNIDSTLLDLNELLLHRPAAYTAYTASAALVRNPGDRQSNPIKVLNTPPPPRQVAPAAWREVP